MTNTVFLRTCGDSKQLWVKFAALLYSKLQSKLAIVQLFQIFNIFLSNFHKYWKLLWNSISNWNSESK